MVLFAIGAIGCVISIPIVAVKFFSVLFEKDVAEETGGRLQPDMSSPSVQRGD